MLHSSFLFKSKIKLLQSIVILLMLAACAKTYNPLDDFEEVHSITAMPAPEPDMQKTSYEPALIDHGKYMVEILGCGNCHTDGALLGNPNFDRQLAGSHIGIAYTNPLEDKYPGIVYPSNLTPDPKTGIAEWSDDALMKIIRSGIDRHGIRKLSVMPWPAYAAISDDDTAAIVAYLRSLAPVSHQVPKAVSRGHKATAPYVHFGMYRTRQE